MLGFPLDRHHIREYVKHPRALFEDLLIKEATTINTGARLKVESDFASPLHGKPSLRSGWKSAVTSPLVWPCQASPRGGFISRIGISRLKLLPDRPSFLRAIRSPDGRFDRTRCRLFRPSWHRMPSRRSSVGPTRVSPDEVSPAEASPSDPPC